MTEEPPGERVRRQPAGALVLVTVYRLSPEEVARHPHVAARDATRARVVMVPWLPPGVAGMTLDRVVLVRRGHVHDRALLAHELVHVEQWRLHGAIGFLTRYLTDYTRGRLAGLDHGAAYRAIPFEAEARARSGFPGARPPG